MIKNNSTPLQHQIEKIVTHGLGYNTQTQFFESREKDLGIIEKLARDYFVSEEEVKNSPEGLKAHLYELDVRKLLPLLEKAMNYFSTTPLYKYPFKKLTGTHLLRGYQKEITSSFKINRNRVVRDVAIKQFFKRELNGAKTEYLTAHLLTFLSDKSTPSSEL